MRKRQSIPPSPISAWMAADDKSVIVKKMKRVFMLLTDKQIERILKEWCYAAAIYPVQKILLWELPNKEFWHWPWQALPFFESGWDHANTKNGSPDRGFSIRPCALTSLTAAGGWKSGMVAHFPYTHLKQQQCVRVVGGLIGGEWRRHSKRSPNGMLFFISGKSK